MIPSRTAERLTLVLAAATGIIAIMAIAAHSEPLANDDTYIYFNYARNFVEGRPFAYDPRNIPSEGFTSVLYLLLLVPFEAAGVNMTFIGALLNIVAVALILYLGYRVLREDRVLEGPFLWVALALFSLFLAQDRHIPIIVGRGLETLLGPASVLWALVYVVRIHQRQDPRERVRALEMFFVVSFVSFLIRPENIVILGAVGGLILVTMRRQGQLSTVWMRLAGFVGVLVVYFVGKLIFFGDAFQTGFYRKVHTDGAGVHYVLRALEYYRNWAAAALAFGVIALGLGCWRNRQAGWSAVLRLSPKSSIVAIVLVCGGTLIAFLPSEPLIGYAFRYLINFFTLLYLLLAVGIAYLLSVVLGRTRHWLANAIPVAVALVATLWAGSVALGDQGLEHFSERLNLHRRAEVSTAQHRYIQLGEFLRDRIANTKELTFMFGDAGVFPYALRSRFIDANGLTEPYIARLFSEPNGPEKARKFSDYVLSWEPDIIILAFGPADRRGRWASYPNDHSPFRGPTPISVFRDYRNYGIGYVCTGHAYYDLHFGVRQQSKYFKTAASALLEYCEKSGLVLADGLTVTLGGEKVHFPRLVP